MFRRDLFNVHGSRVSGVFFLIRKIFRTDEFILFDLSEKLLFFCLFLFFSSERKADKVSDVIKKYREVGEE